LLLSYPISSNYSEFSGSTVHSTYKNK